MLHEHDPNWDMLALAGAAFRRRGRRRPGPVGGATELGIGVVVGGGVGLVGGIALQWARRRGWAAEDFAGIAVLALAILAYTAALSVHGNGFVAAFCGGSRSVRSSSRSWSRGPTSASCCTRS